MRLAIISDIHGNLEALYKVLSDISARKVDGVACLGDCVGYGADPEAVVKIISRENIPAITGNHEEAVFDDEVLEWFNPQARKAIIRTREMMSEKTMQEIKSWPGVMDFHGARCVHGFPPDSVHMYLFEAGDKNVVEAWGQMNNKICFVGHTHALGMVAFDEETVESHPLKKGTMLLDYRKYIINVGSVGQPRDGDNSAKYVIWDTSAWSIEVRYINYDIRTAAQKILSRGMPEFCARRLW